MDSGIKYFKPSKFRKGDRVSLHSFENDTILDAAEGRVIRGPGEEGRYTVKILRPKHAYEAFPKCRVLPINMMHCDLKREEEEEEKEKQREQANSQPAHQKPPQQSPPKGSAAQGSPGGSSAPATDLPLKREALRLGFCKETVDLLRGALEADQYPDQSCETIFGIKMEPAYWRGELRDMPIGKLVYRVWSHLHTACIELELIRRKWHDQQDTPKGRAMLQEVRDSFWNDVTIALKDVRLPAWFESKVNEILKAKEFEASGLFSPVMGPQNAYLLELKRRGFDKIEWEPIQEFFRKLEWFIKA